MRLKELRKQKKLRQCDVAEVINCSQAVYSRYESGEREPSMDTLKKLSDFYGVSVDYILDHKSKWNSSLLRAENVNLFENEAGGVKIVQRNTNNIDQQPTKPDVTIDVSGRTGYGKTKINPEAEAILDSILNKLAQLDEEDRRTAESHIDFLLNRKKGE